MTSIEVGFRSNPIAETTMNDGWLSKEISQIIVSPHISFPKPPGSLLRMGPGPVDLFSTRFNNTFAFDVKATVAGKNVSRDELKERLLGLQKHWKAEEVNFQDESEGPHSETVVHVSSGKTISMSAETEVEGGRRVIKKFTLDGDPSLFE
ncbi:hypothetical protein BDM02DRAFT_360015 [Thelephora ganbajun]|uniref:Uncharacterized protein n=1 Tax=Thelephora ganbajun TaxID=370292 RepID=A0ACB6ZRN9_THEGA|nr:hypothetical protein BDM02DRAFT_360015 [Thelephora ganbajun]